jgi:hypothetical protein
MIKSFFTTILLSASLFSQSEAYDALKVLEPFIGEWYSKHKSIGAFEGLPNNEEIISTTKYEWITDKSAILETWRSTSAKNEEKRVNVGSIVYSLDPSTNTIKTKHFGYDGKVYWSGKGWIESKDSTVYIHVEELTINGTKTNYTNVKTLANDSTIKNQYINFMQNGKALKDQPMQTMRRSSKKSE